VKGLVAAMTAALLMPQAGWSQEARTMKIRLIIEGQPVMATLYDNATSRDLLTLLPISQTFEDYASTEKIAYLPRKLASSPTPADASPAAGDITYYAPWGNLAIFHRNETGPYASGLIRLGRIDAGADLLKVRGPLKITIEAPK
jgi:hypothetical protein